MRLPHPLILASRSPRRHQLLTMLGIPHRVVAADVQEIPLPREAPAAYARRLARDKARAVPGALVLGADTTVVLDGDLLEKPADPADALRMLLRLQGRRHEVITAVCLLAHGEAHEAADTTTVQFRPMSEASLRAYVATGEPMDKAGAYAVQEEGGRFVVRVEGSRTNVMGLPMEAVTAALGRFGISPASPR